MDVLSDVLQVIRLSGAVFFAADFSTPWAIVSPNPQLVASIALPDAEHVSLFHILVKGDCVVECGDETVERLESGDVMVFPHGDSHTMRSHAGAPLTSLDRVFPERQGGELPRVAFGGGGPVARFICGYLSWDRRFAPFTEGLPRMMLVRSQGDGAAVEAGGRRGSGAPPVPRESGNWLRTTLRYAMSEATSVRPGNGAMLRRLIELMFVEIIRQYMDGLPRGRGGWLAGLQDPQVGAAIRLLHAEPARNWTVGGLAHEVAVSRSVLARRFTEIVGASPIRYLADWRMQLARQMLCDGNGTVQSVAARVGYESEPAFTRAFKRATGLPPAAWRRSTATHEAAR